MKKKEDIFCYDCGEEIIIKKNGDIKNGYLLSYKDGDSDLIKVFKCQSCYEKNPSLENFRKCEIYSRVCGYIRPVQQWNKGKKQEYKEREEYSFNNKIIKNNMKIKLKREVEEKVEDTKLEKVVKLLNEKVPKLFDRDPQGSLRGNLVDELAQEILDI